MDGRMSTKFDPGVAVGRDYREGMTTMGKAAGRRIEDAKKSPYINTRDGSEANQRSPCIDTRDGGRRGTGVYKK